MLHMQHIHRCDGIELGVESRIEVVMVLQSSGSAILTQIGFIAYIVCVMGLIGMQCFDQTEQVGWCTGLSTAWSVC